MASVSSVVHLTRVRRIGTYGTGRFVVVEVTVLVVVCDSLMAVPASLSEALASDSDSSVTGSMSVVGAVVGSAKSVDAAFKMSDNICSGGSGLGESLK